MTRVLGGLRVEGAKDAFGHPIEFGVIVSAGKKRRDGKIPVKHVYRSTGSRITKLMTPEELEAFKAKYASDSTYEFRGI
jgi:hypothetical protein